MVKQVRRIGSKREVIPTRSGLIPTSRSATASAQATSTDSVRNDFFVGPEGVCIETTISCGHDIWLAATCGEGRPCVELVIPGQIAADGYVIWRAGVIGKEGCQGDGIRRREVTQDHEAVVDIEA